jgi:hypothetical protein
MRGGYRGLRPDLAEMNRKKKTHGLSKSNIYRVWRGIIGGRSYRKLEVCERWRKFDAFLEDMGFPEKGQSIDRIDNDLGYSPENCRWVDAKVQANNRRNNRKITYNGTTKNLGEWADELGICPMTLKYRLNRGWGVEKSFKTPVKHYNRSKEDIMGSQKKVAKKATTKTKKATTAKKTLKASAKKTVAKKAVKAKKTVTKKTVIPAATNNTVNQLAV